MNDFTLEEMRSQAYDKLWLHAEPDCTPSVEGEIAGILNRHQRCEIWTANTPYIYGDEVQLYPRNGSRYMCLRSGTSGATAPTWSTWQGCRVGDNDITWQEIGADYENVFDIRAAAHEAWTVKAARASHLVTTSAGNSRIEASALQDQCRARAKEFAPVL